MAVIAGKGSGQGSGQLKHAPLPRGNNKKRSAPTKKAPRGGAFHYLENRLNYFSLVSL